MAPRVNVEPPSEDKRRRVPASSYCGREDCSGPYRCNACKAIYMRQYRKRQAERAAGSATAGTQP